jgi:hypothetical protein
MTQPGLLTPVQIEVARIFFQLQESDGYVLAGGAALLARNLISRPTEDLDLFTSSPATQVTPAKDALHAALQSHGFDVTVVQENPTFCRMALQRDGAEVLVDLGIDSPPTRAPTMTLLGPTLPALELAGRKLLALFGRAEARDFADVYVLSQRWSTDALMEQAHALDPGFDPTTLAQMLATMSRFTDDDIPLKADEVPAARSFFATWADELARDTQGLRPES